MANWKEIRKEWEENKTPLKELAEKHNIKLGTLKSKKSREKWGLEVATIQPKKVATKKEKVAKVATREPPEMVIESDDLTEKQKLFCLYYIKYFNATKAYQKAYKCDYLTANANGSRMLVNASIKEEIGRLKAIQQHGLFLDAKSVLQKYIDIAFSDITDFVEFGQKEQPELNSVGEPLIDENGDQITYTYNYVDFKGHSEVDGTIIAEVKKGKDGVSVRLVDKMRALDFLAKYTDLLSDKDRKQLEEEKLKLDIDKKQEELKNLKGNEKGSRTIIVTGEDEMRRILDASAEE